MTARLIQIGNSKGIRLPKAVLQHCGLGDQVSIEIHRDRLVLRPVGPIRRGWDAAFARMRNADDDKLLDIGLETMASQWDEREWQW